MNSKIIKLLEIIFGILGVMILLAFAALVLSALIFMTSTVIGRM